jgi:hypothetical protein
VLVFVSLFISDIERLRRLRWATTFRLHPCQQLVEVKLPPNNCRKVPDRYWFWAMAAALATNDMRLFVLCAKPIHRLSGLFFPSYPQWY